MGITMGVLDQFWGNFTHKGKVYRYRGGLKSNVVFGLLCWNLFKIKYFIILNMAIAISAS